MVRFSRRIGLGLALLTAACGAPPPPPIQSANAVSSREQLSRIVERYWDERLPPGAALSAQQLADSLAVERRALTAAAALSRDSLDPAARLSYDIFVRRRELDVAGFTYPSELMPIEPFESPPFEFAREAAKAGEGQLANAGDYEKWLARIDAQGAWMRQAIANMREGVRRGYTTPKVVIERALPLLEELGRDSSANVLYSPARTLPNTIKDPERTDLGARLTAAVRDKLLPAYRELHDFLRSEYLPKARDKVALTALPLGNAWYAYLVRRATSAALAPEEIHALGLGEVERIRVRVGPAAGSSAPAGDPIAAAEGLKARVLAAIPSLFSLLPAGDFEIRAFTPRFDEAPMIYRPLEPGAGRVAVLYVAEGGSGGWLQATAPPAFLQAALPGRHLQSALQQENAELPRFRRFGTERGFSAGWAAYAASLGEELGLYNDDDTKRDALVQQLHCAAALVVDTGLHAKGWTREQAVDYLRTQAAMGEAQAAAAADRYIALPADALACGMGELKFRALRAAAQQALGARFDVREFHAQVLKDGSMPLDLLDAKITRWVAGLR